MKGFLIFPALVVALLMATYFESKLFIVFLILIGIRILFLKSLKLNILTLILLFSFLIRCQLISQQVHEPPEIKSAIISPDKITVNGDIMTGEMLTNKQTVKFIYRLKTKEEQAFWVKLNEIVEIRVDVKKIEKISKSRNIGEFNYFKYLTNKGIYFNAQINDIKRINKYVPRTINDKINVLRIHTINYLAQLPKWLRIHAQSLIVGYTEYSDKNFLKILSVLGVIHLFSLSGLHVLILLTIIRKITSLFRFPLEWIDTVMLFILPCYGILVGSKSGIWRAIVLAMLGIIFKKLNISMSRLDIFSLTLIICMFIYPFAILEMGGQLSFLLSFAILYLYQKTSFLLMTFKMNLVSLPLICVYMYQFNWLTLLANLFFVPFFSYVILPITIISSLTVNWSFWKFINNSFEKMYGLLDYISKDNNFMFVTGRFPSWIILILVIIVIFYVESKNFWNKYLIQFTIIFTICVALNKFPIWGSVTLIDVGQGDSILITTPLIRKTFLIDTGGKLKLPSKQWEKHTTSDQIDNSTIPFLRSQGISYIDKLFLSHKDVDHIGNLDSLLEKFKVKEVAFGTGLEQNTRIKEIMKKYPQIKFQALKQGDILDTGFIKWQVLWPKVKGVGENSDSLTLLARIKNKNWLFTGDLDVASEKKIIMDHKFHVDYLKLGHHGSKTSTSNELLNVIKPQLGFISAGVNNRYGHPNKETIQRLQQHRVQYLNTAEYGMISWYYSFFNDEEKITTFLKGDLFENNRTEK